MRFLKLMLGGHERRLQNERVRIRRCILDLYDAIQDKCQEPRGDTLMTVVPVNATGSAGNTLITVPNGPVIKLVRCCEGAPESGQFIGWLDSDYNNCVRLHRNDN